jgi:hypothetical protein
MRVFENRALKRIFRSKRDEVTGEWRSCTMRSFVFCIHPPNISMHIKSRRMRWSGHVACMGEERKVYKVLMRKLEGKRPLRKPRRRWDQNDLGEIGLGAQSGSSWLRTGSGSGLL